MRTPIAVLPFKRAFRIYWHITDFCNQHCYYCPPLLNGGDIANSPSAPTHEQLLKFVNTLPQILGSKELIVQFAGGEPTLHKSLPDIATKIKELVPNSFVGLTTNGTSPLDWWKNYSDLFKATTISLHPQYLEKPSTLQRVLDNSLWMKENSSTVLSFNLMTDPTRWDVVLHLYNTFSSHFGGRIIPKVLQHLEVHESKSTYEYSEEQSLQLSEWQRDNRFPESEHYSTAYLLLSDMQREDWSLAKWIREGWNQYKDWDCWSGQDSINVKIDGSVWNGVCRTYSLGHISDFSLKTSPVTCPVQYCACPTDLLVRKQKVT